MMVGFALIGIYLFFTFVFIFYITLADVDDDGVIGTISRFLYEVIPATIGSTLKYLLVQWTIFMMPYLTSNK